jgi:hypothetical protein
MLQFEEYEYAKKDVVPVLPKTISLVEYVPTSTADVDNIGVCVKRPAG